ncbi:uncharacterized protein LOC100826306 [Brachypodium distachyon]|uniref:Uncharacterized protein n=1 Tax=Brachypodium distachyon TaxID=15368 RepID=I1J0M8_BRADI|nr:uncharacterized protein LOC100826306 [Brachypodium distachyon]KQJ84072.1 hypothetical protein BRADI_5g18510v3 [Brachypodium distachyon]|eukprot:XP_003580338.1 uncharacterized protein LOC100826306 [Brachypodium distachyon]
MSDVYKKAKPGRLVFKGGEAATLRKPKKQKQKKNKKPAADVPADADAEAAAPAPSEGAEGGDAGGDYTIDAAKRMKYEELFPVETRKFGYDPTNAARTSRDRTVEEALDDRVRKKADRYCK